jgi:tight adherence protein B
MSPTLLISVAAFVGVTALVAGVAMMLRRGEGSLVEDRLESLAGGMTAGGRPGGRSMEPTLLSQPLGEQEGLLERFASRFGDVRRFLDQAGIHMTPSKFLMIPSGLGAIGIMIGMALKWPVGAAAAVGVSLSILPFVGAVVMRRRRLAQFGKQLPEALELLGRALRAGHSLSAGMQSVAEEMASPIADEFGRVYESQNLGIPLDEALEDMTKRVPNVDLRFFATAVILQRQTGGDLAEILDKIGHLIRERYKIWGQVKALTGEGRLSGIILLALPPVLFGVMFKLNPDYVMILFTDPLGKQMLVAALIMQVLGALVIRKIVNIKV